MKVDEWEADGAAFLMGNSVEDKNFFYASVNGKKRTGSFFIGVYGENGSRNQCAGQTDCSAPPRCAVASL